MAAAGSRGQLLLEGVLRAYGVLVRVAVARENLELAYELLAQAEALGHNRQWDRLVAAVLRERGRVLLSEGRLSEASACVVRLDGLVAANPVPVACARSEIERYRRLACAELACAQGRWTQACEILERLHGEAQAARQRRLAAQIGSSLALALHAAGDGDRALLTLRGVLDGAARAGLYRSILDAGPDMLHLLERFRASSRCAKALEPLVQRLLSACRPARGSAQFGDTAAAPADALSPRERDILVLIAEGKSNKEVARVLGMGPETVKTHLKHIFVKLAVERRAQAAARARSLGLIGGT
ncbi:MAG: hypothetical protein JSS18_12270 [Proteobacteria bacterium]|nr:hypothetical protein [Pseudomonadota bacterium]